ncbi:MAG: type II toxin-antitoxin system VapC family toxin [Armatimonadetes bacterium]|nr:type II toxin-antitoxin system VapC family toxin [Armatimonadota bacterium]
MRKSVYIETSIVSYLTARPSRSLTAAAWQQVTADWWQGERHRYELCTSSIVHSEARSGDELAAQRRSAALEGIPELVVDDAAEQLAEALMAGGGVPRGAPVDALHIAVAAVNGVRYLLTWNCRHVNNPATRPRVRAICAASGYDCPEVCTPLELLGEGDDDIQG